MQIDELIAMAHDKRFGGNVIAAEKLYLEAAERGSGHAAHELGVLYSTGGDGLEPDFDKSQHWFRKSVESGFEATIASDPEWMLKVSAVT